MARRNLFLRRARGMLAEGETTAMNQNPDDPNYPDQYPAGPAPRADREAPEPAAPFGGGPAGTPFGGAPIYPPPPPRKKSRKGLYILLFVLFFFCLLTVAVLGIVGMIASSLLGGGVMPMPSPKDNNMVALVRIEGLILDPSTPLEIIRRYEKEKKIRAVVVRIDSQGGAVGASQELYEAILRLRRGGKKVVASLGNMAASGGYYVACAADEIVTNPGTLTGSIGVIFSVPNLEKVSEKIGVRFEVVKSGKFKDTGSVTRTMTPEERELLQGVIDDTYNQFVEAVLEHRSPEISAALEGLRATSPEIVAELKGEPSAESLLRHVADGRVFTGRQALAYGLVDSLGDEAEAVKKAGELAGISKPEVYEYKPRRTLRDLLESEARSTLGRAGLPVGGARLEYRMPF